MSLRTILFVKVGRLWLLLALFLTSCLGLDSQDLAKIFKDGKVPPALLRLANQIHELPRHTKIMERVAKDQSNKGKILPVAIMDSGVDIAHKDLVDKIHFDVKDGKIVGAGYDAMGKDTYGASTLVDPSLFAFGATDVTDGVITGAPERPLELMEKMNEDFVRNLMDRLNKNPKLKNSLFSKIQPDSISVIGAYSLLFPFEDYEKFDPEAYKKKVKNKELLYNLDTREKLAKLKKLDLKKFSPQIMYGLYDTPWKMNPESGLPLIGDEEVDYFKIYAENFEHADLFFEEAKAAYAETDKKWKTTAAIKNYLEYGVEKSKGPYSFGDLRPQILKNLNRAFHYKKNGLSLENENFLVQRALIDFGGQPSSIEEAKKMLTPVVVDETFLKNQLNDSLKLLDQFAEFVDKNNAMDDETASKQIKDYLKERGEIKRLVEWWTTTTNITKELSPSIPGVTQNDYAKLKLRSAHPYLAKDSNTASHGTHVAGIVQKQHGDIRIVPVRVTTQSVMTSKAQRELQKAKFLKEFEAWISEPVVARAMQETFQNQYPQLKEFPPTEAGRRALAKEMLKILAEPIDTSFGSNNLNYQFIEEIQDAISYIGKNKIKITNISLGTEFDFPVLSAKDSSSAPKLYEFLEMEFYKYQVAKTIKKEAPNTVFVVAAGNSGKWVDGKSKSAVPMDLSSPFLDQFEDAAKGELAPNNHLDNLLAVGSLNSNAELSSFTNIPIGVKTPFILAHGEQILSPVRTVDQSGITKLLEESLPTFEPDVFNQVFVNDENIEKFAKEIGIDLSKLTESEKGIATEMIRYKIDRARDVLKKVKGSVATNLFLAFPDHRARLSGTSMATPAVSGILGERTIERAKKLGIPLDQIYDHPEFSAEKIIDDAFEGAESLAKGKRIIPLHALLDDKTYDETPPAKDLAKFFKDLETEGKGITFKDGIDCSSLFRNLGK